MNKKEFNEWNRLCKKPFKFLSKEEQQKIIDNPVKVATYWKIKNQIKKQNNNQLKLNFYEN